MKPGILLSVSMAMLFATRFVLAQDQAAAKPKEFEAGKPLGSTNEAGQFTAVTSNVKVYGSFRFAESCTYDAARNLIVVMNAGVAQTQEPNDGYVSLLNPDG